MELEHAKGIAHRFIHALHTLEGGSEADVEEMVGLYAEDARLTNAALAGKELTGTEGARQFWSEYRKSFGEVRSEFSHVIVDANAAGLFWTTEGSGSDGKSLRYDGVSLLEWSENGKIRFFRGYYDTRELSRELGIEQRTAPQR
ncbi:MAG TPA: nuclear transport factor 2 family protein [Herpetosiphonaceae bacterium]|nr:nuclear transport factor 2 family protein [Herpetosiphonaceae bacterium]